MDAPPEIKSSVSSRAQEDRKDVERLEKDALAPADGERRAKSASMTKDIPAVEKQQHSSPSKILEPAKQQIKPSATVEQTATASVVCSPTK